MAKRRHQKNTFVLKVLLKAKGLSGAPCPPAAALGYRRRRIECFNPPGSARPEERRAFTQTNDGSLVMKMTYSEVSFLFPGDVSFLAEEQLLSAAPALRSQLLFVPHHGRTSSSEAFLHRVRPQAAIISVGADNLFRLPHPEVMKRLHQPGRNHLPDGFAWRRYRSDGWTGTVDLSISGHP